MASHSFHHFINGGEGGYGLNALSEGFDKNKINAIFDSFYPQVFSDMACPNGIKTYSEGIMIYQPMSEENIYLSFIKGSPDEFETRYNYKNHTVEIPLNIYRNGKISLFSIYKKMKSFTSIEKKMAKITISESALAIESKKISFSKEMILDLSSYMHNSNKKSIIEINEEIPRSEKVISTIQIFEILFFLCKLNEKRKDKLSIISDETRHYEKFNLIITKDSKHYGSLFNLNTNEWAFVEYDTNVREVKSLKNETDYVKRINTLF